MSVSVSGTVKAMPEDNTRLFTYNIIKSLRMKFLNIFEWLLHTVMAPWHSG